MTEFLQILQLVVGCMMIVGLGAWLFLNYRWNKEASGALSDDKKLRLNRYMWMLILFLVVPNFLLIFISRALQ